MTYDERANAIGDLIRNRLLARKRRPEVFDDETARAELADMVADLNAAWPIMPRELFDQTGENLARELRAKHAGRDWPSIATMLAALKAATTAKPAKRIASDDEPPHVYEGVRAWWLRHKDRCPYAQPHHSARLVNEALATWGQLRRAGYHIPDDCVDAARSEPHPDRDRIMADLHVSGEILRANDAPSGSVALNTAKPPQHWAKEAGPGDPRWDALRKARESTGLGDLPDPRPRSDAEEEGYDFR